MTTPSAAARELQHDESFLPVHRDGVIYPFGETVPAHGEMVEIAPGIRWGRLQMHGPLKHVNVLALDEADGSVTVVDTGFNSPDSRSGWEAMLAGPLGGRRVSRVLCTHYHPDHVGLAGWLCARFEAPLWMTRGEWLTIRMLAADARAETPPEQRAFWRGAGWDEARIARAAEGGFSRMASALAPLPLGYRRIVEGETISIGDRAWEVVVGSGHSVEHACLLDRDAGILIAGDQLLPRISSNVSLGVTEPEADPLGEWLASLAKLRTLPEGLLAIPGHGEPFQRMHERAAALAEEHHERLDRVEAHLAEPRCAVDCFGQLFARAIGDGVYGMATGESLAHLRHLEVTGRAVREVRDGVWWFRRA